MPKAIEESTLLCLLYGVPNPFFNENSQFCMSEVSTLLMRMLLLIKYSSYYACAKSNILFICFII